MRSAFRHPAYIALAASIGAIIFCAIVWVPIIPLAFRIATDSALSFLDALPLIANLFTSFFADVPTKDLVYGASTAVLIGINTTLIVFYMRTRTFVSVTGGAMSSLLGTASALFGVGCAACGSFFITALIGTAGSGLLTVLPYHGAELAPLGIALLLGSTMLLSRSISKAKTCPV